MLAVPVRVLGRICRTGGVRCSKAVGLENQACGVVVVESQESSSVARHLLSPFWLVRSVSRSYTSNNTPPSYEGGFQSGSGSSKDPLESKFKEMQRTLPWSNQAKALFDFGILFACFGFAFASSLRANHRQVLHDEEMEALNLELAETQDEILRIKSNWAKIDSFLTSKATVASRGSQPSVPLSLVQELANKELFRTATHEQDLTSQASSSIITASDTKNSLSSSSSSTTSTTSSSSVESSIGSSKAGQTTASSDSPLPRPFSSRVILYQS